MCEKIYITDRNWLANLEQNNLSVGNFWRKKTSKCNMEQGTVVYFLGRKTDSERRNKKFNRSLYGMGIFKEYKVLTVEEAWEQYKKSNGVNTKEEFLNTMLEQYGRNKDEKIGCMIFDITIFNTPIILDDLNIQIKKGVQTEMNLTDIQSNRIKMVLGLNKEEYNKVISNMSSQWRMEDNKENSYNEKYYLVYLTTDLTNGMKYIGKHETNNINDGYLGSGRIMELNIKLKGKENFSRKILHYCLNSEHMAEMEKLEINKVKAYDNNMYYNLKEEK